MSSVGWGGEGGGMERSLIISIFLYNPSILSILPVNNIVHNLQFLFFFFSHKKHVTQLCDPCIGKILYRFAVMGHIWNFE